MVTRYSLRDTECYSLCLISWPLSVLCCWLQYELESASVQNGSLGTFHYYFVGPLMAHIKVPLLSDSYPARESHFISYQMLQSTFLFASKKAERSSWYFTTCIVLETWRAVLPTVFVIWNLYYAPKAGKLYGGSAPDASYASQYGMAA